MTTKELITWVNQAEKVYEGSYVPKPGGSGGFTMLRQQAIEKTKPENATEVDIDLAFCLIHHAWNDVQYWHKTFKGADEQQWVLYDPDEEQEDDPEYVGTKEQILEKLWADWAKDGYAWGLKLMAIKEFVELYNGEPMPDSIVAAYGAIFTISKPKP